MLEKSWHLSTQNAPLVIPSDENQRDWIDRFEHWPNRVIQSKSHTPEKQDIRTACMASSGAITLHLSRKTDCDGVQLDQYDQMIKINRPVSCLAFGSSRHNQTVTHVLASGHANGEICLWHADSSHLLTRLISHSGAVSQILFSSEANNPSCPTQIVSVSHDRTAKVWDLEDYGYNMSQTVNFPNSVLCSAWSVNTLAFGCSSQKVYVYQKTSGGPITVPALHQLAGHLHSVVSIKFWPDGSLIVSASRDGRVHIWDHHVGSLKQVISLVFPLPHYVFPLQIKCMDISRHGNAIVTLSENGLSVWNPMSRLLHVTDNSSFVLNTSSVMEISMKEDDSSSPPSSYRSCSFAFEDSFLFVSSFSSAKTQCIAVKLPVPSLKHLCRLIIRRAIPESPKLQQLSVPPILASYLAYDLWN